MLAKGRKPSKTMFYREYNKCMYTRLTRSCVAQSVMCMATDAKLTADPGVASSTRPGPILYWSTACSSLPRKKVWLGELTVPP